MSPILFEVIECIHWLTFQTSFLNESHPVWGHWMRPFAFQVCNLTSKMTWPMVEYYDMVDLFEGLTIYYDFFYIVQSIIETITLACLTTLAIFAQSTWNIKYNFTHYQHLCHLQLQSFTFESIPNLPPWYRRKSQWIEELCESITNNYPQQFET